MKHFLLIALLCTWPSCVFADLVYQFNNPAFAGQGYSSHVMAIEQLQKNREEEKRKEAERIAAALDRGEDNSVLAKFTRNLESRIYATLSKQLVDSMFASCGEGTDIPVCPTSGSTEIEGAEITWTKDSITGGITLVVDGPDGYTEVTIPGPGEFNF